MKLPTYTDALRDAKKKRKHILQAGKWDKSHSGDYTGTVHQRK